MEEEKRAEDYGITPYRFNQLMKIAGKVTDQMVNGIWHLTYDEMGIVLDLLRYGMEKSMEKNTAKEEG